MTHSRGTLDIGSETADEAPTGIYPRALMKVPSVAVPKRGGSRAPCASDPIGVLLHTADGRPMPRGRAVWLAAAALLWPGTAVQSFAVQPAVYVQLGHSDSVSRHGDRGDAPQAGHPAVRRGGGGTPHDGRSHDARRPDRGIQSVS